MKANYFILFITFISFSSVIFAQFTQDEIDAFQDLNNVFYGGSLDMDDICSNSIISCFQYNDEFAYNMYDLVIIIIHKRHY